MRNEHKLLPCHSLEHAPPSSGLRMKQNMLRVQKSAWNMSAKLSKLSF